MAFIGSINAETRRWLGNNGPAFDGRQVYVGCSGAFTVEALISKHSPKAKIWGNDVSLYSSVLGAYLAGQPFNLSVREEKFAWLTPFLADGEAKAATVMVLFEALKYEKDKNLFQHRHWSARCFRPGYPVPRCTWESQAPCRFPWENKPRS